MTSLLKTPLHSEHLKLQAKMVDFGGWEMPVQYSGVIAEHLAVRSAAGLFDTSHMGQIFIEGVGAESFINELITNDITTINTYQAQYTALCNSRGGIIDDLITYKFNNEKYLLIVNASNTEKDFQHILNVYQLWNKNHQVALNIKNVSHDYALLALQGPKAEEILLSLLTTNELTTLKPFHFLETKLLSTKPLPIDAVIARTGYTGEDGFEILIPTSQASSLWNQLLESGKDKGLLPCGLGARDTLRLEKKYSLYGHELNDETTPLEVGLSWVTKLNKPSFFGKEALVQQKQNGIKRALVGFMNAPHANTRGIARQGYEVYFGDQLIGHVTSGTHSPSLKQAIGLALIQKEYSALGTVLKIKIRDQFSEVEVVKTPFV